MSNAIMPDAVTRACADALAKICAQRLTDSAIVQPAASVAGPGWLGTLVATGAASGQVTAWFDDASARTLTRAVLKTESDPTPESVRSILLELLAAATGALETTSAAAGLMISEPSIAAAVDCPAGASTYQVAFSGGLNVHVALAAEFRASSPASRTDMRLEAVLDVDLPLIVRFGRTVMPLRSLADLGPGSVVDMGRSPDEPVELLVGERLIARGEVVIVGGNYGVRITELAANTTAVAEWEAKA